jgi:hypothetical protein
MAPTAAIPMPSQADVNYEAFKKLLPELVKTHAGKFAVMHDGKVVEYFDTLADAAKCGVGTYGQGKFSVQEVTSKEINLGFYSYALYQPTA